MNIKERRVKQIAIGRRESEMSSGRCDDKNHNDTISKNDRRLRNCYNFPRNARKDRGRMNLTGEIILMSVRGMKVGYVTAKRILMTKLQSGGII